MKHKGEMVLDEQMLQRKNLTFLASFGDRNTAIKSLVLNESLLFSLRNKTAFDLNQELVQIVSDLITVLKGNNLKQLKFNSNQMSDFTFK